MKIKDLYANSDERIRHLQVVNEKGYSQEYPITLRKKDGTIIDTLITTATRKDSIGRIIGYRELSGTSLLKSGPISAANVPWYARRS